MSRNVEFSMYRFCFIISKRWDFNNRVYAEYSQGKNCVAIINFDIRAKAALKNKSNLKSRQRFMKERPARR